MIQTPSAFLLVWMKFCVCVNEMVKLIMEIFRQLFAAQIWMHIKYGQPNRNAQNPQLNNMNTVRLRVNSFVCFFSHFVEHWRLAISMCVCAPTGREHSFQYMHFVHFILKYLSINCYLNSSNSSWISPLLFYVGFEASKPYRSHISVASFFFCCCTSAV